MSIHMAWHYHYYSQCHGVAAGDVELFWIHKQQIYITEQQALVPKMYMNTNYNRKNGYTNRMCVIILQWCHGASLICVTWTLLFWQNTMQLIMRLAYQQQLDCKWLHTYEDAHVATKLPSLACTASLLFVGYLLSLDRIFLIYKRELYTV